MAPAASSAECSPLLRPSHEDDSEAASIKSHGHQPATSRRLAVAIPCLLLLAAVEIGVKLLTVPMAQIQEGIICRGHYPDVVETPEDPRCKDEVVQSDLSMLQGWEMTFALIPGLLTAVPYGIMADRYGRKVTLSLSLLGMTMVEAAEIVICRFPDVFPIRLIWLATQFNLIGGGPFVFSAMVLAIASDVSTEAQRSTTFFYLAATTIGGELISGPLAYMAMARGAWFSVLVGFGCLSAAVLLALTFPETRRLAVPNEIVDDSDPDSLATSGPSSRISAAVEETLASIQCLFWENKRLGLLLFSLIFTTFGTYVSVILMQYTTKRFGWTWSEAALLSSLSASVNLALVAAILPIVSQVLLVKFSLPPQVKDAWLARAGILALVTGTFGIGLASNSGMLIASLVVYALGSGYGPSMKSLLASVAGERHIGILFTAISVLETIGMLVAGPLMAATFRIGLGWGEFWIGLPFISTGCLLTCAAIIVFGVRVGRPQPAKQYTSSLDDEE